MFHKDKTKVYATAQLHTPVVQTTDSEACLILSTYMKTEYTAVSITLKFMDGSSSEILHKATANPDDWNTANVNLPEGVYRVVVAAEDVTRTELDVTGVAIDDISITPGNCPKGIDVFPFLEHRLVKNVQHMGDSFSIAFY